MDVSIIVVNFNTMNLALKCIYSIYEQTSRYRFEVILWDNASSDGSQEAFLKIKNQYSELFLYLSDINYGFAKANNLATENARGRYILLLNPDTEILDGAIDKLVNFADSCNDPYIIGGSTFFSNGERNTTSCWSKPTRWSLFSMGIGLASLFRKSWLFNPESFAWWSWTHIREVDIVTGCFMLIPKKCWEKLKGFDLDFFMYGEDADLCFRAKEIGINSIIYPEATIIHHEGQSEPIQADKIIRLFEAKQQLFRKHYSTRFSRYGKRMLYIYAFSRMVVTVALGFMSDSYRVKSKTWKEVYNRLRKKRAV